MSPFDQQSTSPAAKPAPPAKKMPFKAPASYPTELGVTTDTEEHVQGFVASDQIRKLLDAFGLQHRVDVQFPFQHIQRAHGEQWRLRIEPAGAQTVNGTIQQGHQWIYQREIPESVAAAA
jgi:hypothetical protein